MRIRARLWLVYVLLELARRAHPYGARDLDGANVWQIIRVPRRISEEEERQLSRQVKNL